ncbi:hypothetical protein K458DRAFT_430100 [Lentithecium fluviatile CBS 122367]|uniref:Transcription factor domain-containing protein n=1 Tax=Lentithecium fluviatile CBS 122367 TaxID=1168545 RepID=A0A6G1J6U7_9PLEO|nr:hypothetical protein K458DRAFT_430100 [Lentithecium fluviatile CBS 122367]
MRPNECAYHNAASRNRSPKPADETPHATTPVPSPSCTAATAEAPAASGDPSHDACDRCSPTRSLAAVFRYHQGSDRNTMALLRRLSLEDPKDSYHSGVVPPHVGRIVQQELRKMPRSEILDFLTQYCVSEIHWHDQIIEPSSFVDQYRRWWNSGLVLTLLDVEFAVVILRICSYASLFLPSPSRTIDTLRGMSLSDIRSTCDGIGDTLSAMAAEMDRQGSLTRVAKELGLYQQYRQPSFQVGDLEVDKELGCRAICILYIWDNQVSRQLNIAPIFSDNVSLGIFALEYQLASRCATEKPHSFTERALQVELCRFWRNFGLKPYDLVEAEERYERFSLQFLANLPPAFSLNPDKTYDESCPKLPLQRQIFHIAVFESICCNFRPVLATDWEKDPNLPSYKRMLLSSQKRLLATMALKLSAAAGELYVILGTKYTRSVSIVFYTFEAAILLGCVCLDLDLPDDLSDDLSSPVKTMDFPGDDGAGVTKQMCLEDMTNALARLEVLAEVSVLAEAGAETLSRLLSRARSSIASSGHGSGEYLLSDEFFSFLNTRDKNSAFRDPRGILFDQTFSPSVLDDSAVCQEISELDYAHTFACLLATLVRYG